MISGEQLDRFFSKKNSKNKFVFFFQILIFVKRMTLFIIFFSLKYQMIVHIRI